MDERCAVASRVTWVGFFLNLFLTLGKFVAGMLGYSSAMLADAIHSLSDLATDVVVLVGYRFVNKPPDDDHGYGHGKYESLMTAIIGGALLLAGAGIFHGGVLKVWGSLQGEVLKTPGMIALWAALASMVAKEWLYRHTAAAARQIKSNTLLANAWHHRSDVFSSIGTALGIGGAIFLGPKWRMLDPLAAMIVSIFIIKVAIDIIRVSFNELTDSALPDDVEAEIMTIVTSFPFVTDPHNLRTRTVGSDVALDIHVRMPEAMSVKQAHAITAQMETALRQRFGANTFISIHVEPESHPV